MKRVLLGMSGGVDSSAAVILLQNMGYEVVGLTFKFIEDFDPRDAIKVAEKLSIEHHVEDYQKEFKKEVIDRFLNDYKNGLTPNPCVICNKLCKFKFLFENMEKYNCDYVATGHYSKIEDGKLYRSKDLMKDQSYFLYSIPQNMVDKIIFPLEGLSKDKVREIAGSNGLENANKKDSFDVCFIKGSFNDYIKEHAVQDPGDVIDIDTGKVIGKHKGLMYYTIGQRRGLDIGGTADRMFVVGKEHDNYLKNLENTKRLNDMIKDKYPTLTRGVLEKEGAGVNGIYNQDLGSNIMLIEVGGNYNNISEVANTIDLIIPIIGEYINEKG